MSDEQSVEQVENEAKVFGWVPLEDFRGGEDKWVDAETFVKRGKEINPILKKNNELLLRKLDEKNKEIEEVKKISMEFREFQKEQVEKRIKEYDTQIAQLKQAKVEAVSQGDGERVVAIDDAIDAAKEEKAEAKEAAKEQPKQEQKVDSPLDPVLQAWIDKNDWYSKDRRLRAIANDIAEELRADNPNLIGQPFLDKLAEEVESAFPDKFKKNKPNSPVEGGSGRERPAARGSKTYENLPADAKEACDRFVKTYKNYTREKFLAEYQWD